MSDNDPTQVQERALERILELVSAANKHITKFDIDDGAWSHADFDEITYLIDFLEPPLKQKLLSLVPPNFSYAAGDQKSLALRILRAKEVLEKFGPTEQTPRVRVAHSTPLSSYRVQTKREYSSCRR